jgi:N-hydroxyarylamine O-acetyltransferase
VTVAGYLARIRYAGPLNPTLETLRGLHRAHLLAVPFENLDIHTGRPIVLDEEAFYRKVAGEGRGGFCYELNGLFAWLLRELGFRVTLLSAGVAREAGGFGPEFDHLILRVDLDQPFLADVGFGECFRDPIPLAPGGSNGYRLREEAGHWTLFRGEAPQYRFTLQPRALAEFAGMCEHHQTSPESSFTRERIATLATADGRVTLSGCRLIRTLGDTRIVEVLEAEACRETLEREFGIRLERY